MTSEPATGPGDRRGPDPDALMIGARIGARFEALEEHDGGAPARAFFGVDLESGRKVMLVEVASAHAAALERVIGLEHRHLARVLAVEKLGTRHILVAEHCPGLSLEQRLSLVPKKAPVDAVRLALRLADALSAIHDRGGVHGLVSALSLVVAPDNGPRPVLGFAPGSAAALRGPGGSVDDPSSADDAWAAAALLHWMITGHAPPELGFADLDAVRSAGIDDDVLARVLYQALGADSEQRSRELKPLRRELARWFVDHAGEDPAGSSVRPPPSKPPPLPARSSPPDASGARRSRPIIPLALGAVTLGLLAGWALSAMRAPTEVPKPRNPSAARTASGPSPVSLAEIPVTGASARVQGDKLLACVAGYMPPETFVRPADVSWVCSETSPRFGAEKLRSAIVGSAPRSGPSAAMKIFARLGWYDMAAFAVVRAGCCPEVPPLELEGTSRSCPSMVGALDEIGEAVVAAKPLEAALRRYRASIHCELNMDRAAALGRSERPVGGEDAAFLELVRKLDGQ